MAAAAAKLRDEWTPTLHDGLLSSTGHKAQPARANFCLLRKPIATASVFSAPGTCAHPSIRPRASVSSLAMTRRPQGRSNTTCSGPAMTNIRARNPRRSTMLLHGLYGRRLAVVNAE
eukprot:scaffold10220_cov144-Isochrysis_galbana.AAC.11